MKKVLIAGFLLLTPVSLFADLVVEKEKEKSEDKGGSLGAVEVVSIVSLAGIAVFLTRKKAKEAAQ